MLFQSVKQSFHFFLDHLQVAVHQKRNKAVDFIDAPVPPFEAKQQADQFVVETLSKNLGRIACHNRIRRDIAADHAVCTDDCTVSDVNARQNDRVLANPYIIPYDGVSLERKFLLGWR